MAKPNGFGYIKLQSDPSVLFLVMAARFFDGSKKINRTFVHDTPRNIHTKFESNWSSRIRDEDFFKEITLKIAKKDSEKGKYILHENGFTK